MGLELESIVEALLTPNDGAPPAALDREQLTQALRNAYEQGQREAKPVEGLDPSLEVIFFRELMKFIPDFVYFKDAQSRFLTLNPAHAAHFGLPIEEIVGKTDHDFFIKEDADKKFADEQKIIKTGKGFAPRLEHQVKANGEEMWALSTKHPWHNAKGEICGTFGHSRDVTAKTHTEQAFAKQHRLLQILINVLPCRIFVRDREHRFRLINEEYRRNLGFESMAEVIGKRFEDILGEGNIAAIEDEDETIMVTGVPVLRRVEYDISPVSRGKWVSISKVPLRGADGHIEGIVGVAFDISAQKEAEAHVRATGKELAAKNEQIESELALARKLQIALATFSFPSELNLGDGVKVRAAYLYEPSEHLAGDFFQLLQIDDHCFAAFICDVMGHGVRSALVTAVLRGLIEENREELRSPKDLFSRINRVLFRLAKDPDFPRFVTAALAVFDTRAGSIRLVNAGHPPTLLFREDDAKEHLHQLPVHRDPALGLIENFSYRVSEIPIASHCSYIFYTDGILEQPNEKGFEFGREGIFSALEALKPGDPEALIHRLEQSLIVYAGWTSFADDVCAMALSIEGLPDA